jgi:zinc transporter
MQAVDHDAAAGFRWAYLLNGSGGARKLSEEEARGWKPAEGPVWIHMERTSPETQAWISKEAGLDAVTAQALLAEETRPRCLTVGDGALLLILRGVNLNPGAEPDDMVALRLWSDGARLISLRHRRLRSTHEVADQLDSGAGPPDVAGLLVRLASRMTERLEAVLENLDELADGLEEAVATREPRSTRSELAELRRQVIAIRRYLSPQRLALSNLAQEPASWLLATHRGQVRELADRTTRYVEDLEALRERAGVIHDELISHVSEQLNARMYVLSLVAAVFLPLGLLTGLLGINVGGMPGAENPRAFWLVCALLVALGVALAAVLRWRRWL